MKIIHITHDNATVGMLVTNDDSDVKAHLKEFVSDLPAESQEGIEITSHATDSLDDIKGYLAKGQ